MTCFDRGSCKQMTSQIISEKTIFDYTHFTKTLVTIKSDIFQHKYIILRFKSYVEDASIRKPENQLLPGTDIMYVFCDNLTVRGIAIHKDFITNEKLVDMNNLLFAICKDQTDLAEKYILSNELPNFFTTEFLNNKFELLLSDGHLNIN